MNGKPSIHSVYRAVPNEPHFTNRAATHALARHASASGAGQWIFRPSSAPFAVHRGIAGWAESCAIACSSPELIADTSTASDDPTLELAPNKQQYRFPSNYAAEKGSDRSGSIDGTKIVP